MRERERERDVDEYSCKTLYLNLTQLLLSLPAELSRRTPTCSRKTPLWNLAYDDFWGTPPNPQWLSQILQTALCTYIPTELLAWGAGSLGYHLGNVLCHAVTTAIFTLFVQALFVGSSGNSRSSKLAGSKEKQSNGPESGGACSPPVGLIDASRIGPASAGLLFAAHPIHTEAVAGIVGRAGRVVLPVLPVDFA